MNTDRKIQKQFDHILSNVRYKNCVPVLCVTGKMACGKNFICNILEKEGFKTIDFDKEAHKITESLADIIVQTFSTQAKQQNLTLLKTDGSLDRKALGKIVFSDEKLLLRQEEIVYPALISSIENQLFQICSDNNKSKAVIFNAAVLYKIPQLLNICDAVVFVRSSFFKRLLRAKKRDCTTFNLILKRFKTQKALLKKYRKSGIPLYFINN